MDASNQKNRLRLVGLTGGMGSGKSTVAEFFRALHVKVFDADQITRDLVSPDQPSFPLLLNHFGKQILNEDGSLNRSKLKTRIFQSIDDRLWLENLLHPLAKSEILGLKEQVPTGEYWVVAIPLLVETRFETAVDRVLVVDCSESQQIARVIERDSLSRDQIEAIIKAQADRKTRLSKAHDIILNEGTKEDLKDSVLDLHELYSFLAKN